jgi:paraquat-inducible protein B
MSNTDPIPDERPADPPEATPQAILIRRSRISVVWLIPLVALAIGAWLAYKTFAEQGPTITIDFDSATGLQAGKTKVKFRDVDVGEVTAIDVTPDLKRVSVTAKLKPGAEPYLTEGARFWVERPRVTASRVSGLETLFSGAYIAIDPVTKGKPVRTFVGLEEPPLFTTEESGKRFVLRSETLGSLNIGSPVYYRQIQVGQVVGYRLDPDGRAVDVEIFVAAPHDAVVLKHSRFWNASGVDFSISASGVQVDTESLLSVLIGGVSFDNPDIIDSDRSEAPADSVFTLFPSRDEAHAKTFSRKERYLLFFQGSVRGLSVGAPVVLRGIDIGKVLDIQLQFGIDDFEFHIPVLVEVEPDRIDVRGDAKGLKEADVIGRLVDRGLRGELKTSSLLTGELYIDLDFHPKVPRATVSHYGDYLVLPTVPTAFDVVTTRVASILDKLDRFPIEQIGQDAQETVANANRIVGSPELKGAITESQAAFAEVRKVAERLSGEIAPSLETTLAQATSTLKSAEQVVAENSPVYIEMTRMFKDLSDAARSVRQLSDYLERHPEALLKGKGSLR